MKVTVDLPDWIVNALMSWHAPPEHVGPSIEDRLAFLADEAALAIISKNDRDRRARLYKTFGLILDGDDEQDDDIDL